MPLLLALPPLPGMDALVTKLEQSYLGCHFLIHCLKDVRRAVERDGELTETMLNTFKKWLRDQAFDMGDKLGRLRAGFVANPEKLEPTILRARHCEEVLKYLDGKIRSLEFWMDRREEREATEEKSWQAAAVLPADAVLDKILRYETALLRQITQAMNQLERLQRRRQGEVVPPPLALDVTTKG